MVLLKMVIYWLRYFALLAFAIVGETKTIKDEAKNITCVDTLDSMSCEFMRDNEWCEEDVEDLKTRCDKTCGWCSDSKKCVDKATYYDCDELSQEECDANVVFYLSRCRKSCNWCKKEIADTWAPWGNWGKCTVTCGSGFRLRSRRCLTDGCKGQTTGVGKCKVKDCPTWTEWSPWSDCSVTCDNGAISRTRNCSHGPGCTGDDTEERICENHACTEWSACSKSCGEGTRMKVLSCSDKEKDNCERTYEDCNVHECPFKNCFTYRYKSVEKSCCVADVDAKCGRDLTVSKRVIGGEVSKPEQFPWMARIDIQGGSQSPLIRHLCGGTLIHPQYVLTAAHCLVNEPINRLRVVLGSISRNDESTHVQKKRLANYTIHPNYTEPRNDIAVIKLKTPATLTSRVNIICMPNGEETPIDAHCFVAGWGITHFASLKSSPNLMEVSVRRLPFDICRNAYKDTIYGPDTDEDMMMCAGKISGGVDTCRGDSGGPLMCQRCSSCSWYIAGVTSFGAYQCGGEGTPGVYMRVRLYEDWVSKFVTPSDQFIYDCPRRSL